jgi:diphthine synthase
MFYLIGLGLCDELDISIRGLEAVRSASRVYLEAYTSILLVHHDRLQSLYGRPLIIADRDLVENHADEILRDAQTEHVVFLVVGDPFGYVYPASEPPSSLSPSATTHTDILLRARALNVPTRVIHNASILTAVGATGLQLYSFGQTVSLVFFTDTWKPDSYYDRIAQNSSIGAHSLILLDIKVKEQSDINLARYGSSHSFLPLSRPFAAVGKYTSHLGTWTS